MDKVDKALERLKIGSDMSLRYYGKPLMIAYSGGKDSEVLADLAMNNPEAFQAIVKKVK